MAAGPVVAALPLDGADLLRLRANRRPPAVRVHRRARHERRVPLQEQIRQRIEPWAVPQPVDAVDGGDERLTRGSWMISSRSSASWSQNASASDPGFRMPCARGPLG